MSKIFLYHNDCRAGQIFDLEEAQEDYEELVEKGWVDTPADLEEIDEPEVEDPVNPTMTTEEIIQAAKSLGFNVLTDVELAGLIAQGQEPLINRFFKSPTELTKEELIVLGADYQLKLKMTMNESTMIGHITQGIEDSKTEGG